MLHKFRNLNLFLFTIISITGITGGYLTIPNISAQSSFPNFNFAAVGDWDCGSNAVATSNSIINTNPELVVGLGDYSYEANANCWLSIVDPFDHKMKIAIGNHEIEESSQSLGQYLTHFNMPRQYHSFNLNNVHFLVLANDDSFGTTSNQYSFAVNDLQTASSNPNIDWIVVAFHKPLYDVPCSSDSCDAEDAFRDIYHPLFDQYGVDLVLYGHAHNYVRTFPIKYDSITPSSPIITSTNLNNYNDPDGQVFVQSGAGGRSLRDLTGTANYNVFQSDSEFGILNIDVVNTNSNNLQLLGKFIQNDGNVIDQFTISKQATNPPPPVPEICNNGIDDDRDGLKDAEDPNCPVVPEICNNDIDDDRDGLKDGADTADCGYHYEPFLTVNSNSDVVSVANAQNLKLSKFTVASWFKTTSNFGSEAIIVNKGGLGTDSSGSNMNYGIWMTSAERLQAGFETSSGADRYVASTGTYNNGQWHHGVVTFDGSIIRLYVDGVQLPNTLSTTSIPETAGNNPLKIGANSRIVGNLFTGNIDEVGVWDRALNPNEITSLKNSGFEFVTSGLVYRNSFDSSSPPPPPTSNKLIPISVVASVQDIGKEASKAADGDFATRWSGDGDGAFIEFTFNGIYPITKVGLTGYHYDKTYFFEINGKQFQNLANRPSGTLIEYDLSDLNIQSNKVKIIGHGNSGSSYNSYREIQFYTQPPVSSSSIPNLLMKMLGGSE
ncbi:MAG: LamG-like jellyroll fold domain-containing protein [Nitrososphaeraceae archaeon]